MSVAAQKKFMYNYQAPNVPLLAQCISNRQARHKEPLFGNKPPRLLSRLPPNPIMQIVL